MNVVAMLIGLAIWSSACYRQWEADRRTCLSSHHHSTVDEYEACYHAATDLYRRCRSSVILPAEP